MRSVPPQPLLGALACFLAVSATSSHARAQDPEAPKPPAYEFVRQNEDWSTFAGGDDLFDGIKHVKLNADGSAWASFGGRAEARLEIWHDFGFGAARDTETFALTRATLHADLHAGTRFRAFAEGKSAQSTERDLPGGRRASDLDTLDLQQLFVDYSFELGEERTLRVRPGRQMLLFGAQRLVSPLPWGNTMRTWDGLTMDWFDPDGWRVTGLFTAFVPVDKTRFNEADDDQLLYGLYARRDGQDAAGTELYALGNERNNVNVNGTTGDARRVTLGSRRWGALTEELGYEWEAAWQTGEVGSGDVSAGFAVGRLAWTPEKNAPTLFVQSEYASGDNRPGGDVQTFDQLYPLGHAYLGYIDSVGRQNSVAGTFGVEWKPNADLFTRIALQSFWLADRDDALYTAGGTILRPGGTFDSSQIGYELDLLANQRFGRHLSGYCGYSHFFAGDAVESSGPGDDVDFVYFGLSYYF